VGFGWLASAGGLTIRLLNTARYIIGSGPDTHVMLGALFEVILALAIVGTAVALFPVVKRQNEGIALG
jgi:hypothetical protein